VLAPFETSFEVQILDDSADMNWVRRPKRPEYATI
jgi:hypothetical protein